MNPTFQLVEDDFHRTFLDEEDHEITWESLLLCPGMPPALVSDQESCTASTLKKNNDSDLDSSFASIPSLSASLADDEIMQREIAGRTDSTINQLMMMLPQDFQPCPLQEVTNDKEHREDLLFRVPASTSTKASAEKVDVSGQTLPAAPVSLSGVEKKVDDSSSASSLLKRSCDWLDLYISRYEQDTTSSEPNKDGDYIFSGEDTISSLLHSSNKGVVIQQKTQQQLVKEATSLARPSRKKQKVSSSPALCTPSSRDMESTSPHDGRGTRFRVFQATKWQVNFDALKEFKQEYGHTLVPHGYEKNPALARWTKRQRYQYKLFHKSQDTKSTTACTSTMTWERIQVLSEIGFAWSSLAAVWEERYQELIEFRNKFGHVNVPGSASNTKLAIWVKCQRRQYKLLLQRGQTSSNMTPERILRLNKVGFTWELRKQT